MRRSASISECGRYRYALYREWEPSALMPIMWLMLNPSTADADTDDPTIRRCIGFSKAWGYGALYVGNLYGIRSTNPSILLTTGADEARGPENIASLCHMADRSALIVAAWGVHGGKAFPRGVNKPGGVWCLGTTKHGSPKHPLYVKGDTALQEFPV